MKENVRSEKDKKTSILAIREKTGCIGLRKGRDAQSGGTHWHQRDGLFFVGTTGKSCRQKTRHACVVPPP